jgi:hypothetical protein
VTTHIPSDNTSPDDDDVVVQFPGAAQPATDPAPAPEPDIFAEDALDAITPTEQEDYLIPVDMWPQPVDGARLLTEIADTFNRHAILPEGEPRRRRYSRSPHGAFMPAAGGTRRACSSKAAKGCGTLEKPR